MTKAITTAAGMQLVEQGKLALDEPIGKVLPDLADTAGVRRLRRERQAEAARRQAADHAAASHDPHGGLLLRHLERRDGPVHGARRHSGHHHLREQGADHAARVRSGRALGIRHQHRLGRQGGGGRERQAARRLSQGPHLRAARHERHRLQARRADSASASSACTQRGADGSLDAGAVRDGAGAGIPHGRRRALRHRAGLHPLRAHAAPRRHARRQPRARGRDRQADGREPHRRAQRRAR